MRKIVFLFGFLAISIFNCETIKAQRKVVTAIPTPSLKTALSASADSVTNCDILGIPVPSSWSSATYVFDDEGGFVSGTNRYDDRQKANFFDLSGSSFQYLQGLRFQFSVANAANPDNLSKLVYLRAYSSENNAPGKELASLSIEFSRIRTKVLARQFIDLFFDKPMRLPVSKKFFISVDISNLSWFAGDSLALVTTSGGEVKPNIAWEQWVDSSWYSFSEVYRLDLALYIFPLVSVTETKCSNEAGELIPSAQNAISVKSNSPFTGIKFANPFTGTLKLQLNLGRPQTISARIYDLQGKLVGAEKPSPYSGSSGIMTLSSTANLKSGMYILRLSIGKEEAVYKILKQ